MKSLSSYIHNENINESFKSDIARKLCKGLDRRRNKVVGFINELPMWDKIEDKDVRKLSTDQALIRGRARKDPGYIFWYNNMSKSTAVTWGVQVIVGFEHLAVQKLRQISLLADEAYELIDYEKFMRREIRQMRADARRGAVALYSYDKIREENLDRYRAVLAAAKNPSSAKIKNILVDCTDKYKNCINTVVANYLKDCQENTKVFLDFNAAFTELNKTYMRIVNAADSYFDVADILPEPAMHYVQEMNEMIVKLENLYNQYRDDVKNSR